MAEFMELGAGGWDSSQLREAGSRKTRSIGRHLISPTFSFYSARTPALGMVLPTFRTSLSSLLLQSQHSSRFQLHQLFCLVSLTGGKYNIPKPEKTQGLPRRLGKGHLGFAIKRRLGKGGLVGSCVSCDITSSAFIKHQARPCARICPYIKLQPWPCARICPGLGVRDRQILGACWEGQSQKDS